MTKFFLKRCVHPGEDPQGTLVRERCGKVAGAVGICLNALLFAGKFAVGSLTGSVSIVADAVNNLSDAGSSVISLVSFKMANKPADRKHPFGHARIEYIASMIVAFLILLLGVELIQSSIQKILHPELAALNWVTVGVLLASIGAKLWLFCFNRSLGRRLDSTVMQATATDSLSDVLATSAVLLSTVLSPLIGFSLDGYMGVVVAVFILVSGILIVRDTFDLLLGKAPKQDFIDMIDQFVRKYEGVVGVHDLMVHSYGPNRCFASVHVEVDAAENIMKSHDTIDNIERDILVEKGVHLVIHLDPVVTDDPCANALKQATQGVLAGIDSALTMHDFRVVYGHTHSNLIFDVVVPFGFPLGDEELAQAIERGVKAVNPNFYAVVTLDRSYVTAPSRRTVD